MERSRAQGDAARANANTWAVGLARAGRAVVAVIVVLLVAFLIPASRDFLARTAAAAYLASKGFHLDRADFRIGGGVVDVRGIVVTDGGRPFFDAADIRATYGGKDRALGVSSIRIVEPRLFVHREADGSYDVARLIGSNGPGARNGAPFRAAVRIVEGSVFVVSDAASTADARPIELRHLQVSADVEQGVRSTGSASFSFGDAPRGSGLTARFDENDAAKIARASIVVRGAQLAPLVDVPVSSSAFVVERGTADVDLDAYAVGWDQATGPQWRIVGAGTIRGGELRTLPLTKPVEDIAGRVAMFDGTLELEDVRGAIGGVPLSGAGSVELFPSLRLGLRIRGEGDLERVRTFLPFSTKLPLAGDVGLAVAIDGSPADPHADVELRGIGATRYGTASVHGLAASAYYHDGHVALRAMSASLGELSVAADGDVDLTATPVAGEFVVVGRGASRAIPMLADIESSGKTSVLAAFDGPLMRLSGSGFAQTEGGEQRVRALANAGGDGVAFSSVIDDREGGELVAMGELGRAVDSPTAVDLDVQRFHARLNGTAIDLPGVTTRPIVWPRAAATVTGYAYVRGAAAMPSAAVNLSADGVRFEGRLIGRVMIGAVGRNGQIHINRVAVTGEGIRLESGGDARLGPESGGRIGIAAALEGNAQGDIARIADPSAASGRVDAGFSVAAHGSTWTAEIDATSPDRSVRVLGVPVDDVRAVIGGEGGRAVVYGAGADAAGGHIDVEGSVPGSVPGSLAFAVRGIDLARQHALDIPIARGAVVAIGRVGGTARSPIVSGAGVLSGGSYAGVPLAADTDVAYSGGSLAVTGGRIIGANTVADVSGRVDGIMSGAPHIALDASVPEADLSTLSAAFGPSSAQLAGIASGHLRASGALSDPTIAGDVSAGAGTVRGVGFTDLRASIDAGRGDVAVHDGGVTFGSSRIAVSGSVSGAGESIRASSPRVDLGDFNDFFDGKDVLEGRGALDVAISDLPSDRSASGSFSLADASVSGVPLGVVDGRVSRANGDLAIAMTQRGPVSTSDLALRLPPQTGSKPSFAVHGVVSRLDMGTLAPYVGLEDEDPKGVAHGSFTASATRGGFRGAMTFGVTDASVHGVAIRKASGSVSVANRAVTVHGLYVAIDGASATVNGSLDERRIVRAHADIAVDDLHTLSAFSAHPMPVGGSAKASIDAAGPIAQPSLHATVSASDGQVRHVRFDSVTAEAAFAHGTLTTNGSVRLANGRGTLDFSGSVPIETKPFRIGPNAKSVAFDARLSGLGVGALDPLVSGGVTAAGRADGSLHVRGTAGKPTVSGALRLDGITVETTHDRVPLTGLVADVEFANDSIALKRLHAAAGSGTVDARGSAHIVPATALRKHASLQYAFGAQLHGAQVDVPDVMRGTVDAQLGFTKSGEAPYLYGGVQFTDTTIPFTTILALASSRAVSGGDSVDIPGVPPVRPHHIVVYGGSAFGDDLDHIERLRPPATPPPAIAVVPSSVGLNLKVVAGHDVSVDGLLNVTGHGEVDVAGTTAAPTLDGVLTASRGQAGFLNTNFELLDGAVTFRPKEGLIPDVTADAITHTEDADITVSTYGRVDQLHTDLESDPPMDRGAIVATLLHVPQINSALASSHGEEQSAFGVSPGSLVSGAIAGQILGALNIGLEQVFNLEEVDFGLDPFGRPTLEVRKQVSPRAYTLYRTTFSVPPAQALGIAYQVRRALQVELTQSQSTPGALGTYALPQTSLTVKLTFH